MQKRVISLSHLILQCFQIHTNGVQGWIRHLKKLSSLTSHKVFPSQNTKNPPLGTLLVAWSALATTHPFTIDFAVVNGGPFRLRSRSRIGGNSPSSFRKCLLAFNSNSHRRYGFLDPAVLRNLLLAVCVFFTVHNYQQIIKFSDLILEMLTNHVNTKMLRLCLSVYIWIMSYIMYTIAFAYVQLCFIFSYSYNKCENLITLACFFFCNVYVWAT